MKITTLAEALIAIKTGQIDYGLNKEYFFVTDEDGLLILIKRNDALLAKDLQDEERCQWPLNCYDGDVILSIPTNYNRGLNITEQFLDALNIKFLG